MAAVIKKNPAINVYKSVSEIMALCRTGLGNFQQNRFQQKNADLLKLQGLWSCMGFDKLLMNYSSNCQTRGWEPGGSSSRSEACVWIWGQESGNSYTVGRFWP